MAVTDVFSKGIYKSPSLSSADRCQLFYLGHQYTLQQPLLVGHRTEVVRIWSKETDVWFSNIHLHVCTHRHREHRIHTFRWVTLPTKVVTKEVPHISDPGISEMLKTSLQLLSGNCLWAAEKNGSDYFIAALHLWLQTLLVTHLLFQRLHIASD